MENKKQQTLRIMILTTASLLILIQILLLVIAFQLMNINQSVKEYLQKQPTLSIANTGIYDLIQEEGSNGKYKVEDQKLISPSTSTQSMSTLKEVDSESTPSLDKQVKQLQLNMDWSCEDYYCKEGDNEIYPLSITLATALNNTTSISVGKSGGNTEHLLAVVFDPTCSACKKYYKTTLKPILDKGYRIRLFPTLYNDKLSQRGVELVREMLCSNNHYELLNAIVDNRSLPAQLDNKCQLSLTDAERSINKTKRELRTFKLDGITPISISPKGMWFNGYDLETITPYLNF